MGKRRFVIHVGLHHAGGGALGHGLAELAAPLAEAGVRVPARTAEEARRAAIEVRRLHATWGYRRKDVEGAWALLCKRARKEGAKSQDAVVVSDDLLAGASAEQVSLLLDSLAGFEVHVVAVLADPAQQLAGAWSDALRAGSTTSLKRFARRVLDPDRRHEEAAAFWAEHDVPEVLARWAGELRRPDRVHVVVPVRDQDPTEAAWGTVARLLGVDAEGLRLPPLPAPADPDPTTLALLRGLNQSVDGRADRRTQRRVVEQHLLPGRVGAGSPGAPGTGDPDTPDDDLEPAAPTVLPARLPTELLEELRELGTTWAKAVAEGGYAVTGDTGALVPPAPERHVSAAPTLEERLVSTTDALADLLVELARVREHAEDLERRNAKLERKKAKLRTRLAAALAEG